MITLDNANLPKTKMESKKSVGQTPSWSPDIETLTRVLSTELGNSGFHLKNGKVTVIARRPSIYSSTAPSEVVTCRFEDGRELNILCKYGKAHAYSGHGHWGGVTYEKRVYQNLLTRGGFSTPAYYGEYQDPASGRIWLLIEWLAQSVRIKKVSEEEGLFSAAKWIGDFHRANEQRWTNDECSFLKSYDAGYYRGWADRTALFVRGLHDQSSWVEPLCRRFEELIPVLTDTPFTIIHGEFTTANVLVQNGLIYPVDWESTAVAAGELDLAFLTDGWSEKAVERCAAEYRRVRWSERVPSGFERRLQVSRLFVQLRWLGDREERTTAENVSWRFKELKKAGERLGVI
ncbi:MAG: hypothetical protein E6K56_00755 [Ignavibacteria bacterium]|nr:MAG: hypothetical protein E6K56_00755 [Ignavibacteria bacterium]